MSYNYTYTGFNPVKIKKSINNVIDAYSDLQDALITVTQSQFVTPRCDLWCCNQAVKFFEGEFKPSIDALNNGAYKTFQHVVEEMNESAKKIGQ